MSTMTITITSTLVQVSLKRWIISHSRYCGRTTVEGPLWKNQCGRTTVEEPMWKDHCGRTIMEEPVWKNHCGKTNVEGPLWKNQCGRTIVEKPMWKDHCGRTRNVTTVITKLAIGSIENNSHLHNLSLQDNC
jgi:hypothetical protein